MASEKDHAIGARERDEAAAGTGGHVDQKAEIKETEAESMCGTERMETRRRVMVNLMKRRATRAERETRALKSGLGRNAAAERGAPSGDVRKAGAAQRATREDAKNERRVRVPRPESELETSHAAPRRITRMRKRTRAPATLTDSARDLHVIQTPHLYL